MQYVSKFFYFRIDQEISDAILLKLPLQCVSLQDRQVSLAFFSDLVEDDEKAAMAARLLSIPKPTLEPTEIPPPNLKKIRLRDFVGPQSWFLFQLMGFGHEWLAKAPSLWKDDPEFAKMNATVRAMPGVNDFSERSCRLAEDFKVCLFFTLNSIILEVMH